MAWIQKEILLSAKARGFHLVTTEILNRIPEIATIRTGLVDVIDFRNGTDYIVLISVPFGLSQI